MSKEVISRYLASQKIMGALIPEIVTAAFKIEGLADEVLDGKADDKLSLEDHMREISTLCVKIRTFSEYLR